jgi:hypothetical protein
MGQELGRIFDSHWPAQQRPLQQIRPEEAELFRCIGNGVTKDPVSLQPCNSSSLSPVIDSSSDLISSRASS